MLVRTYVERSIWVATDRVRWRGLVNVVMGSRARRVIYFYSIICLVFYFRFSFIPQQKTFSKITEKGRNPNINFSRLYILFKDLIIHL